MTDTSTFQQVNNQVDFIKLEHEMLEKWEVEQTFQKLVNKNKGNDRWSFLDGPITANNPMGVHHAWGRSLKDIYQRYHAMNGKEQRYQNGFDCQGLWVEVEVEKELNFKTKRDVIEYGIENFVNQCKDRVRKYSAIQSEQSKRLGYWMDWDNSYYTMSDENNYTIWAFLKKLFKENKIYKGTDIVPWSGRSGTSYSQMEIIEGRKLVAHKSVFVRFTLKDRENEHLLVWTTTPWTLTSNIAAAVNVDLDYLKLRAADDSIYYFAQKNLEFKRLEKQFKEKKLWIKGVTKLKTLAQIFKERGGYEIEGTIKGADMIGWEYIGPFDHFEAQQLPGGYPFVNENFKNEGLTAIKCHKVIDGGKDNIGNDVVVAGEGTGIVHIASGCGSIDSKIGEKNNLVALAPLDDESKFINGFGWLSGKLATDHETTDAIIVDLKDRSLLVYAEQYPHIYPHCWRSGDELVYRCVDEWYINMDWRDRIKAHVGDIQWIPNWGHDREMEWLENMGDWMISKKRFWGLALPIWIFEDGSFFVVGSKEELKELAIEGWDEFEGNSPHRPWIDVVKIKHPETGLIGTRIPDVGNPWLDAGIVPYSTLKYNTDREYWDKWFPADFVVECLPGQFRNWFYSLLALSTIMEDKAPFKTLLGHAMVKDETGRDMHKSGGNAIWFDDAAEHMGVDVMRWMYASQNPEHNLLFGYSLADEIRKNLITLWNTYSFFTTYAAVDGFNPSTSDVSESDLTQLDHWILAKVNTFVLSSKKHFEEFQVYKLMKEATQFLDDLSNWYIRRNRRRFWKSENDQDKIAAYTTLHQSLVTYIKVLSPIIPFVTEKMYLNLVKNIDQSMPDSIHLCEFPQFDKNRANPSLITEVDTVISIVGLGRSARNKANIKIRQPLGELSIYATPKTVSIAENNSEQILEELNIKSLKIVKIDTDLVSYNIKPNFAVLGQKLGSSMKAVTSRLSEIPKAEVLKRIQQKKTIQIEIEDEKYELDYHDIIVDEIAVVGYSVSSTAQLIVGINTTISAKLKQEGLVRDLIRQVQNLRKDSGLKVEDRIRISIAGSDELNDALQLHQQFFMTEVLGVDLIQSSNDLQYHGNAKINGQEIIIGISPT